jgi:hypothetical protein
MVRALLLALTLCLSARVALATPGALTAFSPGEQCRSAIASAEVAHGVPPQLLAAIGRVESGRRDPATGAWSPWPWTINAEGQGAWFESKVEAIQAVRMLQARGVRSIDVGCMQVNLMHHPDAFPSLEMAFEPGVNADYAARFLVQLHAQSGDWTKATAAYHSANPWEGDPYAAKVAAVWPEEQRRAGLNSPAMAVPARLGMIASPFASHQPPRISPFGGARPGMIPPGFAIPGLMQANGPVGETIPPRLPPPGMMQVGVTAAGLLPPGMPRMGSDSGGQMAGRPGHGLDFYRAAPVGSVPFRQLARGTYRLTG